MLLDDAKRDFISETDSQEETTKMSISAEVESHIIKVLTEHSYDDPLGSSIREAVSNAVDSVTEAGTDTPVIVSIKKTTSGSYEFSVQDFGLGLDDVSFKKYIMGIGESTKRNSNVLLGGYGAGAKAWLAYTNNFVYLCRKNGVERKYLIFKGEEFPECSLIYEQPTTESNGVTVIVKLKDSWNEKNLCEEKIKQQLAYLDNVYYDIQGFENTYKVYRTEHFQYSPLKSNAEMHISLKNICYEIDWNKIGISRISMPIALKFDDYEEIKPIFNRESLQYTSKSIKAIKDKIKKVADFFVEKWNTETAEFDNFRKGRESLMASNKPVVIAEHTFYVDRIEAFSDIFAVGAKIKGISNPKFYGASYAKILECWNPVAYWNWSRLKKVGIFHTFQSYCLDMRERNHSYKVILIDYNLSGYLKTYLEEKHNKDNKHKLFFIKEVGDVLLENWIANYYKLAEAENGYKQISEEQKKTIKEELLLIKEHYKDTFIDETNLPNKKVFIDWKANRQAEIKSGKVKASSSASYTTLDKQTGEITVRTARKALKGTGLAYDNKAVSLEHLKNPKNIKKLTVYSTENLPDYILAFGDKINFVKLNPTEVKHILNFSHFMSLENFKQAKPMARLATAIYIHDLLNTSVKNWRVIEEAFPKIKELKQKLESYETDFTIYSIEADIKKVILENAKETNKWDFSILSDAQEFERILKQFAFLDILIDLDSWRTTEFQKKVAKNAMYIFLKHQKATHKMLEEFELVAVSEPSIVEPVSTTIVESEPETESENIENPQPA